MKMRSMAFSVGWLALMVCLLFPAGLYAGLPTSQVRATIDQVLEILKDPAFKAKSAKEKRRSRLRQVIYPRFDFAEMSRRSLGPTWQRISPAEQQEFLKLFTQLLEDSYVTNIEGYNGEKILYGHERQDQGFAEVDTKITTEKGEEFAINYKLHEVDGDWKIYDVVIENVSIVNNYRSQFNRLLSKSSFAELLDKIREKTATLQ